MNAKNLTDAAKRVLKNIPTADTRLLADHILATVRPDDDEPVTRERLEAEPYLEWDRIDVLFYGTIVEDYGIAVRYRDDVWEFHDFGGVVLPLKSMGHLRRLVAALGE